MEVTVRYDAAWRAIDDIGHCTWGLQDQTPKSGKSGWSKSWSSQGCSITAIYVQPFGSRLRSISGWMLATRGGCDGNVNTPLLLLLKPGDEIPELEGDSESMVKQVDVPLMIVGIVPKRVYVDA